MPTPAPDVWRDARVLVVVAHPDDEVLGCGATLASLRDVTIVHVTDGAPLSGADAARLGFADRAAYAAARRDEAVAALKLAGVPPDRLHGLGIADQAAPAHMAAVARTLGPLVRDADIVLTHAFEGGHGDHDAVAFAVAAADRLAGGRAVLFEMPFYRAGPDGWLRQTFLPRPDTEAVARRLSSAEQDLKARMVAAHATQADTLRDFGLDVERFRPAPHHDFAVRPHDAALLYEVHGWSLTWPLWLGHVDEARRDLGFVA